jgi:hypothetical protein
LHVSYSVLRKIDTLRKFLIVLAKIRFLKLFEKVEESTRKYSKISKAL